VAEVRQAVKTVTDVTSGFTGARIPAGTYGVIVEKYNQPEGYAVDLGIPSPDLVGGYEFDNVALEPDEFVVVDRFPPSPYLPKDSSEES
jgi:hypothetical protein